MNPGFYSRPVFLMQCNPDPLIQPYIYIHPDHHNQNPDFLVINAAYRDQDDSAFIYKA